MNLLDLRGLSVACNPDTGEDLWFLIGIQAEVTGLVDDERPNDHISDLQMVADRIREKLTRELSAMAVAGAFVFSSGRQTSLPSGAPGHSSSKEWRLLAEQTWKSGPEHPSAFPPTGTPVAVPEPATASKSSAVAGGQPVSALQTQHDARIRPDEADVAAGGVAPGLGPRLEEYNCCEFCKNIDRDIEDTLSFGGISHLHGTTVGVLKSIVSFCLSPVLDALQGEGIRLSALFSACLSLTLGMGVMKYLRRSE